jgi:hypothetical protein
MSEEFICPKLVFEPMFGMKTGCWKEPHWYIGIEFIMFMFIIGAYGIVGICMKFENGALGLNPAGALYTGTRTSSS